MDLIKDIKDFMEFRKKSEPGPGSISIRDPILAKIFGTDKGTLSNPYTQLSIVYASIRAKANNLAQVPFKIYVKGTDDEITKGPIIDLFNNVNPQSNRFQLWEAIVTLLDNTGEGAVVIDSDVRNGIPVALYPWNRKNMEPVYQGAALSGWKIKIGKTSMVIPRAQVIFPKYYNPNDQLRGLSPLSALKLSLASEWGAVTYNQSFFEKGSTVGAVYSTEETLTEDAFKRLKNELVTAREGSSAMHQALLLDGGVTLSNLRPSNRDLEFIELRKYTRQEVCTVFGVPESELSLYQDTKFTNAVSADLGFWKKTLIPLMRLIQEQFNTDFLYSLGFEGRFDVQSIDAINAEILMKAESAGKFFDMGYSRNQINKRLNLGFITEDEDIYKPGIKGAIEGPAAPPETPTKSISPAILAALQVYSEVPKEISQEEMIKGLRAAKWKSLMDPILPIMGRASKDVKNYFYDVERRLMAKANKFFTGHAVEKSVDKYELAWIEETFSDERLGKILTTIFEESTLLGVGTYLLPDSEILGMVATRGLKITGINATAVDNVLRGIRGVLDQGIKEGWTELERADAINSSLKATMGTNKKNSRTIARTETHGAYEEGRFEGIKTTNPTGKTWLESRDGKVRTIAEGGFNHAIDGETVAFDKTFSNGLQFPLDPAGEAGNVINCRCTWAAVYEEIK